jgi:hypothetical protein
VVLSVIIILATFVPRGAIAFNPPLIEGSRNEDEEEAEYEDEDKSRMDDLKYDPEQDDLTKASVGIAAQSPAAKAATVAN